MFHILSFIRFSRMFIPGTLCCYVNEITPIHTQLCSNKKSYWKPINYLHNFLLKLVFTEAGLSHKRPVKISPETLGYAVFLWFSLFLRICLYFGSIIALFLRNQIGSFVPVCLLFFLFATRPLQFNLLFYGPNWPWIFKIIKKLVL